LQPYVALRAQQVPPVRKVFEVPMGLQGLKALLVSRVPPVLKDPKA
jgi:hypothetical protein